MPKAVTVAEFDAILDLIHWPDKSVSPVASKTRVALQLLRDYNTMPGTYFDAKYPTFCDLKCSCGLEDDCSCVEAEIVKWGLA